MKRFFSLIFLFTFFSLKVIAEPISKQIANRVGQSFLAKSITAAGTLKTQTLQANLELVYTASAMQISTGNRNLQNAAQSIVPFYVFSSGTHGYVIVAGDDRVIPILGYADEGIFDPNNIPPNMQKWLEGYKAEIRYAIENNISASSKIQSEWKTLQSGVSLKSQTLASTVAPLILTKWDQSPYYNDQCPYDNTESERTVTGCVATAMAQVMKYWNYPATGSGFHSYNHSTYGTLSANYGGTTYEWANMPSQLTSSSSSAQKNAIATLMYHCGVSIDMNYGVASSSAMTICSGYSNCTVSAEEALKTYFGYKSTLQGLHKSNYTDSNWINLLKTELDAGRPIVYAGRGNEGGHCFVCDGYDNNNYFHFNWGWSGQNDGYFTLTALNPGSGGAGGGSFEFTDAQRAIIGIEPATGGTTAQNYDLRLYSDLNISSTQIWFKDAFNLKVDIVNQGTGIFSGQFGAAVFDKEFKLIDFIEIKSNMTLNANSHYNNGITFSNSGLSSLVPGTYYTSLFYKTTTEDWTIVGRGNYFNSKQFEIYYSSDIEVNSPFAIKSSGGTLIQGQSATVNVDVINSSSNIFYGKYRISLDNLDGSLAQTVQILNENNGLQYNYHYTDGNNFTGIISVAPGTYLMEVAYQTQGSSTWYYAGSTNFSNPVYVIVKSPEIQTDIYEENNTQSHAYNLAVSFSGNNANPNSNGSNLHIGTDIDYYKIILPVGYNYVVTPRLHDYYNSGNGQTYTVDALFSYSTNGTLYSETYDDIAVGNIAVNNGGTLYFKVAPYFSGNTGTYLLDLNITRSIITDIKDVETDSQIILFPNPTSDFVMINLNQTAIKINQIILCDVNGNELYAEKVENYERAFKLPLTKVSSGIYFVKVYCDKGIVTKKLVVEK